MKALLSQAKNEMAQARAAELTWGDDVSEGDPPNRKWGRKGQIS